MWGQVLSGHLARARGPPR